MLPLAQSFVESLFSLVDTDEIRLKKLDELKIWILR